MKKEETAVERKRNMFGRSIGNFLGRDNHGVSRRSGLRSRGARRSPRDGVIKLDP